MNIFNFDPATGAYTGTGTASIDPLETAAAYANDPNADPIYLIPANATAFAPPSFVAGQCPVFKNGAWSIVPDHRGEMWFSKDGTPVRVESVGNPEDAGLSAIKPPPVKTWDDVRMAAHAALMRSDATVLRCFESGVAMPVEWKLYRTRLRAIVAAPSGDPSAVLPTAPAYPAGT